MFISDVKSYVREEFAVLNRWPFAINLYLAHEHKGSIESLWLSESSARQMCMLPFKPFTDESYPTPTKATSKNVIIFDIQIKYFIPFKCSNAY